MLSVCRFAGKYTAGGSKPGGPRTAIFSDDKLEKLQPLVGLMKDIGSGHGGKTPAQVAINWVMCKGAIPIVGEIFCARAVLFSAAVSHFALLHHIALSCDAVSGANSFETSLVLLCVVMCLVGTLKLIYASRQSLAHMSPSWPLSSCSSPLS